MNTAVDNEAYKNVVYTVQSTDVKHVTQDTQYGGLLKVITTTVTRTITERVVASDEDDSDDEVMGTDVPMIDGNRMAPRLGQQPVRSLQY
ncbi:hypothetical protein AGDE_14833 [Angomonas deanei]|uniref:Uncharacterized protein n=1 Tax=Angomonas deanei TaxID=59799 RepID=A0A7G2CLF6_9TRYP|nr:hypothetical protein AGDE_14833 [Angomonas deanei]CAD2220255.1 hypothetical protein, conserved [Angomonas deanei]|eukprot:EPY20180.1 hypothetical protein AGDE_14833 [Angomonas deanei]